MECWNNNSFVRLVMKYKLTDLQRNGLASLTLDHIEDTLLGFYWVYKQPETLNDAVRDVLSLQLGDVVGYLSSQAIIDGASMSLSDFDDLIGGK